MARSLFGGRASDSVATLFNVGARSVLAPPAVSVALEVWSGPEADGGTRLTDLLAADGTTAITAVTVPASAHGQIPSFYGPDGVTQVWFRDTEGDFYRLDADAGEAAARAVEAAAAAEAVGTTNDTIIAGRIQDPASATASALSASIVEIAPTAPSALVETAFTDLGTNPVPVDQIDGVLYGAITNTLYKSLDAGATWTSVRTFAGLPGINGIWELATGELLFVVPGGLYRTSGYAADPSTATASLVLTPNASTTFLPWGIAVHGNLVAAVSYQNPKTDSRYLKVSRDGGTTWTVQYDLNTAYPANVADVHWHGICWDPIDDPANPRLFAAHGDGPRAILYSDNAATATADLTATWTTVPGSAGAAGTTTGTPGNGWQPTAMVATKSGIVCGTDDEPSGLLRITRRADPADMAVTRLYAIRIEGRTTGSLYGIAQRAQVADDGTIYVGFQTLVTGEPPIILAASLDGLTAREVYRTPSPTTTGTFFNAVGVGGYLVSYYSGDSTQKVLRAKTLRRPLGTEDVNSGGLLGGTAGAVGVAAGAGASAGAGTTALGVAATGTTSTVAVGTSSSGASQCVAVGRLATAAADSSVAVGYSASAANVSVAIGQGAATIGAASVAVGQGASTAAASSTAVGQAATTVGTNSTAIGASASVTAGSGTAIGHSALAAGEAIAIGKGARADEATQVVIGASVSTAAGLFRTVLVGYGATVTGANATALGDRAAATGAGGVAVGQQSSAGGSSVAIGKFATSIHSGGVALGLSSTTTAADQVAIGSKHFELTELAADPGAPGTTAGRLYIKDDATTGAALYLRTATGTYKVTMA